MARIPNSNSSPPRKSNYRSVWISDIQWERSNSQVEALLDFLRCGLQVLFCGRFHRWLELKFRWFWREEYNTLIQKLLRKSRKQTKVIYITATTIEFLEQFIGMKFGSVTMRARSHPTLRPTGRNTWSSTDNQADVDTLQPSLEKLG